jgi:hypothetical protein
MLSAVQALRNDEHLMWLVSRWGSCRSCASSDRCVPIGCTRCWRTKADISPAGNGQQPLGSKSEQRQTCPG